MMMKIYQDIPYLHFYAKATERHRRKDSTHGIYTDTRVFQKIPSSYFNMHAHNISNIPRR
jgi:hypothetical protein